MEFMKKIEEISKIVGSTASSTYNTVADKSGKLIEETKLKLAISDKEADIEKIYQEMGKTVYDMYKNGEDVGKAFTKECKKIDKDNKDISDMNTKILYNKGVRVCAVCGEIIPVESTFCQNCGEKQKPVKLKVDKKGSKKEEEKNEDKVCPTCGQICEGKAKFCAKCGYQFDK
ncbi:MAG: zinc ribbon domain-containing protein [Clostridia bacterium]|nr:zinc ribbon domain-containing protein [Clostridia bacterium]